MEFIGFSSDNFEFFRKKDKMSKAEYEKNRNAVKLGFRCLCYDMQKLYHKKTDGVLEINKEFSNFSKRSVNISADYGKNTETAKSIIEMNIDNVAVKLICTSNNEEAARSVLSRLTDAKKQIIDFLVSEKHNQINYSLRGKGNRIEINKLNSLDVTENSFDGILTRLGESIAAGKYDFEIAIQHTCPKAEAIKQEKNLPEVLYEDMLTIMDLRSVLN